MDDRRKVGLFQLFTVLYFADVITTLFALFFWVDFNLREVNPMMVGVSNSIIYWIIFKTVIYACILAAYKYLSNYSKYAEDILITLTIVYALVVLNNIAWITSGFFHVDPSVYQLAKSIPEIKYYKP